MMDAGVRAYREGRYIEAVAHFDQVLEADARNLAALDSKAAALDRAGKRSLALESAKTMILLVRDSPKGYLRAFRIMFAAKRYSRARAILDSAHDNCSRSLSSFAALRQQLDAEEARHQQALANPPALSLPPDVLHHLVQLGRHADPTLALRLTHVCSVWRTTLVSNPHAWCDLRLGTIKSLAKTKAWVHRANGRLISLVVTKQPPAHLLEDFAALLLPAMASLQTLELRDVPLSALVKWRGKCQRLSNLELVRVGDMPRMDGGFLTASAHGLRTLSVEASTIALSPSGCLLSDQQLQMLQVIKLSQLSASANLDVNKFLALAPNLRVVDYSAVTSSEENTVPEPTSLVDTVAATVTMPLLESLAYWRCSVDRFGSTAVDAPFPFHNIICPSLTRVRISQIPQASALSPMSLINSWHAFHTQLEVLDLSNCATLTLTLLSALVTHAPGIRFINVSHTPQNNEFLQWLADPGPDVGTVAPCLTALSMVSCEVTGGPVVRLVKSRTTSTDVPTQSFASRPPKRRRPNAFTLHSNEVESSNKNATIEPHAAPACASLRWLCLDGNPGVQAEAVTWLRSVVPFVSCNWDSTSALRTAGCGNRSWDA